MLVSTSFWIYILIFGLHLDVVGATLGTAISNAIICVIFIIYFSRKNETLSFNVKHAKPTKAMMQEIFKIEFLLS